MVGAAAAALKAASSKPTPRRRSRSRRADAGAAAAARAREAAGRAEEGRLCVPAAGAARCSQDRAQDRRARADGRRAAARGQVPRVLGRRLGGADPSRPGRHDLRVQARRRREVQQDHRPRRRSVPRDAGRVGADRSHPRQVHGRHPDSEPEPRADLAPRAARVRRLSPLAVEADAGARQEHSRRAVRLRPRDDAAPADRRLHRHRQVGERQRHALEHPVPRHAGRRAADHDRPEAARARDVRGHPPPADAGRRRPEAGGERAALGGPRNGGALQDARRGRRPQHRAVQPQPQAGAGREDRSRDSTTTATRSSRCPSSSC